MHNDYMQFPIDTTSIALAVKRASELRISQQSLALSLGISQSQVSRIFSGKTTPSSKLATDICNYVFQAANGVSRASIANNDDLMDALAFTWDGSPDQARAIAAVIRSLALLNTRNVVDWSKI
jgi:transcriptional regulator with XRE-family HTH domain